MIERPDFSEDCRIRIVSDLHLGHRKSFVQETRDLIPLLEGCDVLVCNGDTAETRTGPYKQRGMEMRRELEMLCQSRGQRLFLIGGNHDPDVPTRAAYLCDGLAFLMHGDALFKTGAPWGREFLQNKALIFDIIRKYPEHECNLRDRLSMNREIAAAIPAVLSKEVRGSRLTNFLLHAAWPPSRPLRILGAWGLYKRYVRRFARRYAPECQLIITGHMHRRSIFQTDRRLFINTGAFFQHARPWIIDICRRELILSEVTAGLSPCNTVGSFSLK